MSEHTKGEWTVDELTLEEMTFKGPYIPIKASGALMMFDGMVAVVGGLNEKETKANARLIAAAPKLLAACEAVERAKDLLVPSKYIDKFADEAKALTKIYTMAKAAIAEAKNL